MSTPATQAQVPTDTPCPAVLVQAAKFAMEHDRAILLDYFLDSYNGKAFIGEGAETKGKILIKVGGDEFTSLISKLYKVGTDIVVLTENSIYVVSGEIGKKMLSKMPRDE